MCKAEAKSKKQSYIYINIMIHELNVHMFSYPYFDHLHYKVRDNQHFYVK